jgi:hypothetical protein
MNSIPAGLRRLVVFRAGDRCEYCGLAQEGQEATFHIDHIVPRAARGDDHGRQSGTCLRLVLASEGIASVGARPANGTHRAPV